MGALTVGDVLRVLPELRIKSSGGPGSLTTVSIRGSSSTQVLILIDGVPINRPDQPSVDLSSLPIQDVDHVEVLRGPFSGQYGSNTLGGVINIVTKSAPETTVSARGGSYGENAGTLSVRRKDRQPDVPAAGHLERRLGVHHRHRLQQDHRDGKAPIGHERHLRVDAVAQQIFRHGGHPRAAAGRDAGPAGEHGGVADARGSDVAAAGSPTGRGRCFASTASTTGSGSTRRGSRTNRSTRPICGARRRRRCWRRAPTTWSRSAREFQGQSVAHTDNSPTEFNNVGNDLGLYIEDNWQIGSAALITVGLRDDIFQLYGTQADPWGGVVILLSDRASLRLAAGRSFRAPSFDEVAPAFNGNPEPPARDRVAVRDGLRLHALARSGRAPQRVLHERGRT